MKTIQSIHMFKSRQEWEIYVWKQIVKGLIQIDSVKGMSRSLAMMVTEYEKKQIIKRVAAAGLLKQGKTYHDIAKMLWLSPSTISALRKSMRTQKGYTSHYARHKKQEKTPRRLTKAEWEQLRFTIALGALFTIPQTSIYQPHRFVRGLKKRKKDSR